MLIYNTFFKKFFLGNNIYFIFATIILVKL